MVESTNYKVEITVPAARRYQQEILLYLLENFSLERASQIDDKIIETVQTLSQNPARGRTEENLKNHQNTFRFIIFKETRNLEIKIMYFVNKEAQIVYITDFFPVLMNPGKIRKRS